MTVPAKLEQCDGVVRYTKDRGARYVWECDQCPAHGEWFSETKPKAERCEAMVPAQAIPRRKTATELAREAAESTRQAEAAVEEARAEAIAALVEVARLAGSSVGGKLGKAGARAFGLARGAGLVSP